MLSRPAPVDAVGVAGPDLVSLVRMVTAYVPGASTGVSDRLLSASGGFIAGWVGVVFDRVFRVHGGEAAEVGHGDLAAGATWLHGLLLVAMTWGGDVTPGPALDLRCVDRD